MIRAGVPPKNPFFSETGVPDGVAYYYLWHFSAAVIAVMTGASGWEADAALVWFTALASLLTMIGLAARLSGKMAAGFDRRRAGRGRLGPRLAGMDRAGRYRCPPGQGVGSGRLAVPDGLGPPAPGIGHLRRARLSPAGQAGRPEGLVRAADPGSLAAAGFQCSIWVGGVTFALGATSIALYLLWSVAPERRLAFVLRVLAAAALALAISFPFIRDQLALAASRGDGPPIVIAPVAVLGTAFPDSLRRLLDLPAYWLLYLPVEFAAVYPAGLVGLYFLLRDRGVDSPSRRTLGPLALLTATSLVAAWLLRSVVAINNDLGWRAILPGLMLLIVFAAAAIARWPRRGGAPLSRPRDRGRPLDAAGHAAVPARGFLRVAHAVRTAVRANAVAVAGGAPACGTRRADRQQSAVPGRHDAVAHQYFLGADGRPALVLCRQRACRSVRADPGCRAFRHRGALRARLRRRAGRATTSGRWRSATAATWSWSRPRTAPGSAIRSPRASSIGSWKPSRIAGESTGGRHRPDAGSDAIGANLDGISSNNLILRRPRSGRLDRAE